MTHFYYSQENLERMTIHKETEFFPQYYTYHLSLEKKKKNPDVGIIHTRAWGWGLGST